MSTRSGSPQSEEEGERIRPYGEDPDSSEESEDDDPEEAKRIAEGFIVDEDEGDEGEDGDAETPEERRRRRKEEKRRKRKRDKRLQRERELSDDELELLNENRGYGGSSKDRPLKRARRDGEGDGDERLQDMFADDEDRLDDDDDDLGDFIEEDEEAGVAGETEEERKQRRREEKQKRREAAKLRPDLAGVDRGTWDELFDVFGDGNDYDWALAQEEDDYVDEEQEAKREVRLEHVFDPSEIKERRLQREDQIVQSVDRPERHQLLNSTLSDDPVFAPETPFPSADLAAEYACTRVSLRTRYIFCGLEADNSYYIIRSDGSADYAHRRPDLFPSFKAAVAKALSDMFVSNYEVPYLWHYQRDSFAVIEEVGRPAVQFLERDDLWTVYTLGIKFQAIYERLEHARTMWRKVQARREGLQDDYFEQTLLGPVGLKSIESAAEAMDWLEYHYGADVRAVREDEAMELEAQSGANGQAPRRLPERMGAKEARDGPIMQLVAAFGLNVPTVATDFQDFGGQPHPPTDATRMPAELAAEFAGPDTPFISPEAALNAALNIVIAEFSKDPSIRDQGREFVKECADITITPTDRGMTIIDKYHDYNTFKFLTNKPARDFAGSPQWLQILKAEDDGLVSIDISVRPDQTAGYIEALERCCKSADHGEVASAWNELRKEVCSRLVSEHLMPIGKKWLREYLRGQAEDYIAEAARQELEYRVNVRPFATTSMELGATPSVLALSNGRGDIRDAVIAVFLDDRGNVRQQTKFDNLRDEADREAFIELVMRRKVKVVAVGGMSVQAARLRTDAATALREVAIRKFGENPPVSDMFGSHEDYKDAEAQFDERLAPLLTTLIVPNDATARMYMESDEAKLEHPNLPATGRYALALARFVQNPLNAYAKLGRKILDVTFLEHYQRLVTSEKLLVHLERGLVNSVCSIGLDMAVCVSDPYTRAMLPFVAGLGPRKADILVKTIQRAVGMPNRNFLLANEMAPGNTYHNFAGFLSIVHDLPSMVLEADNPENQPDPLDSTRIHPEDYEFAQKICQDALDLDIEDVEGQHPSEVVLRLMLDHDRARKLSELNMDDFAYNLSKQGNGNKRNVLGEIINEFIKPREDRRPPFFLPSQMDIVTMFTGESAQNLMPGMQVTVNVRRVTPARAFCLLDSGLDAILEREYIDGEVDSVEDVVQPRQSLKAIIIAPEVDRMQVKLSIRQDDINQAVAYVSPFKPDPFNSDRRREEAEAAAKDKKRRQAGKVKRVVTHPNWHVMNSGQAEQFLASQPRGEVVVRPSSKGPDHLALTFKLDEDVFQHVDVKEIDKPNEYSLGRVLRIGDRYSFGDLDDLIVNYVRAVMRMLEMAERNEKWKPSSDELDTSLKNALSAFPDRSMYGFCLDTDRPGFLRLAFLNKSTMNGGAIQNWPVRLLPGAYQLGTAEVPGMPELCNAFKAQYSSRLADQGAGGKTPGIRAGRTPHGGRTPGGRTPGMGGMGGQTPYAGMHGGRTPAMGGMGGQTPYGAGAGAGVGAVAGMGMGRTPVRPGMTPNPYGAPAPHPGAGPSRPMPMPAYAAMPGQAYAPPQGYPNFPPQQGYGGMPPPQGMPGVGGGGGGVGGGGRPPQPPSGMNPERAAMIARQGY